MLKANALREREIYVKKMIEGDAAFQLDKWATTWKVVSSAPSGSGLLTPSYKRIVLTLNLDCMSHIKSTDRCIPVNTCSKFLHYLAIASFKSCVGMFGFMS